MIYLSLLPVILGSLYALWIFFLALMNLKRARDAGKLTTVAYKLALPILGIGYSLDVLVNLTITSILLLEIPQEWTVSSRMSRHIMDSSGWRKGIALWVCRNLLDSFDPSGTHCNGNLV